MHIRSGQVRSRDIICRGGDLSAEEADILLHAGLSVACIRSSGIGRLVHSLTLSDQLLRCLPRLRPPSTVPCMMVLHRLSCRVTWPNQASLRRLIVARSGSWGPTKVVTVFLTYSEKFRKNVLVVKNTTIEA